MKVTISQMQNSLEKDSGTMKNDAIEISKKENVT
jgi:hypothetical protein